MKRHDLESGTFYESKDFVCHLLNMNNETNEKGGKELMINEADFEQYIVTGFKSYPFPVDSEIILRDKKENGFYSVYRISRFKPVLFSVEIISFKISTETVPTKYISKEVKNKDNSLFKEYSFFAEGLESTKQVIGYKQEIMNINQIAPILESAWKNRTSKEYYLKVFSQFLKNIGCTFELDLENLVNPNWYNETNFY